MKSRSSPQENKYFKRLRGMIVPQRQLGEAAIAFLAADGHIYPIMPGEKCELMKNLVWDSVSVLGRVFEVNSEMHLEVLYFSFDVPFEDGDAKVATEKIEAMLATEKMTKEKTTNEMKKSFAHSN